VFAIQTRIACRVCKETEMADLAQWLQQHNQYIIEAAAAELSPAEALRPAVQMSLVSFCGALDAAAELHSTTLVHAVLINWVTTRGVLNDTLQSGVLPVITTIKRVIWDKIRDTLPPADALDLLVATDTIFTDAMSYAAKLESDALLSSAQRSLKEAHGTLERLDKSKADFIAVAAHELKTPLTLIEGYNNMLRSEIKEPDFPRVALMLNGVASGTTRLREIVEDMIDVSMIDMQLLNLHYQPVWIYRMIDIVAFDLSAAMQQRRIKFVVNRSEITDKPTYADSERLYQVFHKVISNAIKYTPDGGNITITSRDLPGFTDLQIKDTGIGIAPENLTHIFEKFSSKGDVALHSSGKVKFKGGGPGLGLAIAKGIIEAHGGSIWAESAGYDEKALEGSIFHIMIPMRSALPDDRMSALFTTKTPAATVIANGQNTEPVKET